jgi:hypothetical protein
MSPPNSKGSAVISRFYGNFGQRPSVHDGVTRSLLLLAFLVVAPAPSVYGQPGDWSYGRRDGVHLRILRDYRLPAGATAQEPIVVIGGTATIDGRAEDDVVVLGGSVRVGPTAVIGGDVFLAGGETVIDPAARIAGRVDTALIVGPDFDIGIGSFAGWWPAVVLGLTVLRLGIVLIVAMLLTLVTPQWIRGIATRASSPISAGAIGLAGEVLFVPAIVSVTFALAVSIIGILLLLAFPFVLGAAALLWVAGFTAVAVHIGAALRGRRADASRPRLFDVLLGFTAITAVTLFAEALALSSGSPGGGFWSIRTVGWVIEWVAWTIGLGAALASLLGGRQPAAPTMSLATAAPSSS